MVIGTELQIKQHCVCFRRWIFGAPQGDFLRACAETAIKSHEREPLEKLVRYMPRPAISNERVIIEGPQPIRVKLKSRERLVALIPAPKFHTTRYYGVLASRSPHRRYLPDKPTPLIDVEHGADGQDSDPPVESSTNKNKNRAKENASRGHTFRNALSKATCSRVINPADA